MQHIESRSTRGLASRLALSLLVVFLAIACGPGYKILPTDAFGHSRLRDSTIARMGGCVQQYAMEIPPGPHSTDFRLHLDENGVVQYVTTEHEHLVHSGLEACIKIALRATDVPSQAVETALAAPEVTPESRKHVGVAQAAGAIVALAPIILAAAGVTIGVYVVVVATDAAIEAANKRQKIEKICMLLLEECLGHPDQPPERQSTWGRKKDCGACYRECVNHAQGQWPEYKCPRPN